VLNSGHIQQDRHVGQAGPDKWTRGPSGQCVWPRGPRNA